MSRLAFPVALAGCYLFACALDGRWLSNLWVTLAIAGGWLAGRASR